MARPPIPLTLVTRLLAFVNAVISLVPIALFSWLAKQFVRLAIKVWFWGENVDLVDGSDCVCSLETMRTPKGLLLAVLEIDGEVTLEEVKKRVEQNLLDVVEDEESVWFFPPRRGREWRHPKLRSTYFWFLGFKSYRVVEEDELSRSDHFAYIPAEQGENGPALVCRSDDEVALAVETLANREIHPEHPEYPLWKFHVFYKSKQKSAETGASTAERCVTTVVCLHTDHVILDGGSLALTVLPALMDPQDNKVASTDTNSAPETCSPDLMFGNLRQISMSQRLLMLVDGMFVAPLVLLRDLCSVWAKDTNPLHDRALVKGEEGRYCLPPRIIPLATLQEVRKLTNVKINAIVAHCVFRALNRISKDIIRNSGSKIGNGSISDDTHPEVKKLTNGHSVSNGHQRKDRRKRTERPNAAKRSSTKFQATSQEENSWKWTLFTPVSTWATGDRFDLANRASALPYTCYSDELDLAPLDSLSKVKETFDDPERIAYAWSWKAFNHFFMNAGPVAAYDAVSPYIVRIDNVTGAFSNVRGPSQKLVYFGKKLTKVWACISMWRKCDVGVAAVSYTGDMVISIVAGKKSFLDREEAGKFLDYIVEEAHLLHEATGKKFP